MTLNEAAALLGVTADTLRQQIAAGRLRATKVGRDWQVEPWAVALYRRNHQQRTTPFEGITYPIVLSVVFTEGRVSVMAVANVTGEGSGPYGSGATVEEAVAELSQRIFTQAEPFIAIDIPEGEEPLTDAETGRA